jgi:hypothetical protein
VLHVVSLLVVMCSEAGSVDVTADAHGQRPATAPSTAA